MKGDEAFGKLAADSDRPLVKKQEDSGESVNAQQAEPNVDPTFPICLHTAVAARRP